MLKSTLAALALTLALASASPAAITVTGTGKVKYTPDIAHVNLGVSSEEKSAADAWKKTADVVKRIFDALKSMGIAEKDLQTTAVSVNPKYFYPKEKEPRLVGYVATYDLSVTVRRLPDVGKVLDLAVENGANRSVGIRFASSDPEKLLDQARAAAVAEARKKSKLYVEGAGAALGLVQSISEGSSGYHREYRFDMPMKAESGQSLPIAAGEQELAINVTLTYGIVHPTKA